MKTISVNVFNFSELSEQSQEKAYQLYLSRFCFVDQSEEIEELEKALKYFGFSLKNLQIDSYCANFLLSYNYDTSRIEGFKQAYNYICDKSDYLLRNKIYYGKNGKKRISKIFREYDVCYWSTQIFIDYIFGWLQKPNKYDTIEDVINEATEKVVNLLSKDYDYQTSEEGAKEYFEANERLFFENGSIYE